MLLSLEGEGEETVVARERGAGALSLARKVRDGQNLGADNKEEEAGDHVEKSG